MVEQLLPFLISGGLTKTDLVILQALPAHEENGPDEPGQFGVMNAFESHSILPAFSRLQPVQMVGFSSS